MGEKLRLYVRKGHHAAMRVKGRIIDFGHEVRENELEVSFRIEPGDCEMAMFYDFLVKPQVDVQIVRDGKITREVWV